MTRLAGRDRKARPARDQVAAWSAIGFVVVTVTVTAAILGLTGKYGMTSGKVSGLLVITVLSCLTAGLVHFMSRPSRSSRPGRLRVLLRLAVAWVTGWLVVAAIVLGATALLVFYGLTHMKF